MSLSLDALRERKSCSKLEQPYPTESEVMDMLSVACTVPDHGSLSPYRFVVVGPDYKVELAQAFQASLQAERPDAPDKVIEKVGGKAYAAPLQIYLIYSPILEHKIPEWEQYATASCTGYAITLAAEALGYGAIWKSFAYSDAKPFRDYLNLKPHEKNLGWVNLGTRKKKKKPREVKPFSDKVELRV